MWLSIPQKLVFLSLCVHKYICVHIFFFLAKYVHICVSNHPQLKINSILSWKTFCAHIVFIYAQVVKRVHAHKRTA